jgi:DNA-binding NtrC family response regulator
LVVSTHIVKTPRLLRRLRSAVFQQAPSESVARGANQVSVLGKVGSAYKAAEAEAIVAALNAALWNRKQAAVLLKIDYKVLLYKMKKLGIGEKKISQAHA